MITALVAVFGVAFTTFALFCVLGIFVALSPTPKPRPPADLAPAPNLCAKETPCLMRRKIALVPSVLPADLCGVSDVVLSDFMHFDKVTPTGKKVLSFKFCPWCGKPYHWQGRTFEWTGGDES